MIVYASGEESDIREVDGGLVDVFVNEQIRRCVTFLYEDEPDEQTGAVARQPVGTAFLIAKALDDSDLDVDDAKYYPERYLCYLVTAGHVIRDSKVDTIFVRLNRDKFHLEEYQRQGAFEDIPIRKDQWTFHPKEGTTDVAVYRLKMPPGHFTAKALPFATLTTKIYTAREGIGAGDEVFFVGLFTGHPGSERVEPVIRFGNISLMLPFEKVRVYLTEADRLAREPKTTPIEAYLIEARSSGGVSGSPVLIYWPPICRGQKYTEAGLRFHFRLPLILGLVFGQYESDGEPPEGRETSIINAGIAIVIPADKIRETIMQKKLADERKEVAERSAGRTPKGAPKPVAGSARRDVEFTQNDFEEALRRASRKTPSPDESKGTE